METLGTFEVSAYFPPCSLTLHCRKLCSLYAVEYVTPVLTKGRKSGSFFQLLGLIVNPCLRCRIKSHIIALSDLTYLL